MLLVKAKWLGSNDTSFVKPSSWAPTVLFTCLIVFITLFNCCMSLSPKKFFFVFLFLLPVLNSLSGTCQTLNTLLIAWWSCLMSHLLENPSPSALSFTDDWLSVKEVKWLGLQESWQNKSLTGLWLAVWPKANHLPCIGFHFLIHKLRGPNLMTSKVPYTLHILLHKRFNTTIKASHFHQSHAPRK